MADEPNIRPSDQIAIVGKNGSGKSVLGLYLFCHVRSQKVFVNVKKDPDVLPFLIQRYGVENVEHVVGDPSAITFKKRVIVYDMARATDRDEANALYARLNTRRGITTLLDESFGPTTSNDVPDELATYLQHGRSSNRRHIAMMQRPVRVAPMLITEAHHLVWFPRGFNARDRKFLADEIGYDERRLLQRAGEVLQEEYFGEYGHLWYEQRGHRVHRRASCPRP